MTWPPDYSYRGFNYSIRVADAVFTVRAYDDTPDEFIVISPSSARQCPEARELVDYLTTELGCRRLEFRHGRSGTYRAVDLQTLEYLKS